MKMVSWNVRGLGGSMWKLVVKALLRRHKVQLTLLQETRLKEIDDSVIRETWGRKNVHWLAADVDGSSGGILILWDTRFIYVEKCWVDLFSVSILVEDLSPARSACLLRFTALMTVMGGKSHGRS